MIIKVKRVCGCKEEIKVGYLKYFDLENFKRLESLKMCDKCWRDKVNEVYGLDV